MNDNLRKIAEEAFTTAYQVCKENGRAGGDGDHIWVSVAIGKAVDLAIQQCCTVVDDAVLHREPASTYSNKIREHFGVE